MSPYTVGVVLVATFVAACASGPEEMAANVPSEAAAASAEAPTAVADDAAPTTARLEEISGDPGSTVVCRDMLVIGSNVMKTYCLSRDDWKEYERRQQIQAREMLRIMQGSAFRR